MRNENELDDTREDQRLQQDSDRLWVEHDLILALRRIYEAANDRQPVIYDDDFKLICQNLDIDFEEIRNERI